MVLLAWIALVPFCVVWGLRGKTVGADGMAEFESPTWLEIVGMLIWNSVLATLACLAVFLLLIFLSFSSAAAPHLGLFWIVPGIVALLLAPLYYYIGIPALVRGLCSLYRGLRSLIRQPQPPGSPNV